MMKGEKKRTKSQFKSGNKFGCRTGGWSNATPEVQYVRPSQDDMALMDIEPAMHEAMSSTPTEVESSSQFKILRPPCEQSAAADTGKSRDPEDCYKIFHVGKLWEMFNAVGSEHRDHSPQCMGYLRFDPNLEEKRGLTWRERVICDTCDYQSEMYKLYTEVGSNTSRERRGRKMATANLGLNIALTQTPIAGSSLEKVLAGGNIEGPSRRSVTRTIKTAGNIIIEENKKDMRRRLSQLQKINKWQGRPENQIPVQVDGVYNNNLYSGVGRTPFQPATQCTVTMAENLTPKKQIVAVECVNKICSKHGFHSAQDECDMQSACSATASMETNIGNEEEWTENCLHQLKDVNMEVKYVTTDGDGKSFEAARRLFEHGVTKTKPVHQLDTRHLSGNHRKYIKASKNVTDIMPGKTKGYRLFLQNRFSLDISQRCHAELQNIITRQHTKTQKLLDATRTMMTTIKHCYLGNHSLCRQNSSICKGHKFDNWISNSTYLPRTFKINSSVKNSDSILMEAIEYRLGDDVVNLTQLNTNTQKLEGMNRAIKRSLPKDKTFSSSYEARAHSALHSVNNGPGDSLRKLCKAAGCPIPTGSGADCKLQSLQVESEKKKQREMSTAFKTKRRLRKKRLFELYEKHREQKHYIKNQVTRQLRQQRRKQCTTKTSREPSMTENDHDAYTRIPLRKCRNRLPTLKNARRLVTKATSCSDTLAST